MRHQRITPSERLWRIRLGKYDVVIHDEMRKHHLCHDRDVKPPGACWFRQPVNTGSFGLAEQDG